MTFTSRIRIYLLLVAILPSLAVLAAVYFQTSKQMEMADHRRIYNNLLKFERIQSSFKNDVEIQVKSILNAPFISRMLALLRSHRPGQIDFGHNPGGLDFLEILDCNYKVLASHHRPGLLGDLIKDDTNRLASIISGKDIATVEYDADGVHAAWAFIVPLDSETYLYAGRYLNKQYINLIALLLEAKVKILFSDSAAELGTRMDKGQLYAADDHFRALLDGSPKAGFVVAADFYPKEPPPMFASLLWLAGIVTLLSVGIALLLGLYITGRARREITNLTNATARVADGDFDTVVMAYEEGEFSQLADAFTEMTIRLRNIRKELSTTEKIAAWQIMGRKIAHEIKNPLTPIAISTDDLRRSYHENLKDFPHILDETTGMIKTEVARLTTLLDQFVSFARMKPATPINTSLKKMIAALTSLYHKEVADNRLQIINSVTDDMVHLDPDAFGRVLINLVKNSLESGEQTKVQVIIDDANGTLKLVITDTGPGFAHEVIEAGIQPYLSTKKDGSGLGLVICQRIIYDHGGTLEIYNNDEGGAGVTIILPRNNG